MMRLPKFLMLLFLIVGLVFASDPTKDDEECDDRVLGIKQDMSVKATAGRKDGQYVWSSIVTFDKKDVSNGQMAAIVHEASEEMREQWDQSIPRDKRPSIMTAIEVDGKVYLASSMKGDYSFIYEYKAKDKGGKKGEGHIRKSVPSEIKEALEKAKKASGEQDPARNNDQHKNDASCGELMASYTYLLKNGGKGLKDKKDKRTIAWLYTDGAPNVDKLWDPCGTDDKTSWGCDAYCSQMGFKVIPANTPEDKKNFPKVSHTEQQELMTKDLREELDQRKKDEDEQKKKDQDKKKKEAEERRNKAGEERRKKNAEAKEKKEEEEKKKKEDEKKGKGGHGKREAVWEA